MRKKQHLFIIFGTTSGLGKALHEVISAKPEHDCCIINRRAIKTTTKTTSLQFDMSRTATPLFLKQLWRTLSAHDYESISLIANAATVEPVGPLGTLDARSCHDAFHVNITNYILFINAFIQQTIKHKKIRKNIVLLSTGAAVSPQPGLAVYCSTKAALEMLAQCIFVEQKDTKHVRVAAIRPGVVDTPMQARIRRSSVKQFPKVKKYRELAATGLLASPGAVAEKIYAFIRDENFGSEPVISL